jgi:hypothetical protein
MFYQNADPESLILVDIILNIKVAYLNGLYSGEYLRQAKVNALPALCFSGQLQSATGEELRLRRTLMPSILDKTFKGKL